MGAGILGFCLISAQTLPQLVVVLLLNLQFGDVGGDVGSVRLMTALPPDDEYCACPRCERTHCHSGLIATGYTRQALPLHEVWMTALDVNRLGEDGDEFLLPQPKHQPLKRAWRLGAAPMPAKKNGFAATARWKTHRFAF